MPFPSDWLDSLFARLSVRYGAAWMRQWDGVDIAAVKADWAEELAGFERNPEAIRHAIRSLPIDRPPTVGQFVALCRTAPVMAPPALPAPKLSESRRAQVTSALRDLRNKLTRAA
jgi:hypothetical protein